MNRISIKYTFIVLVSSIICSCTTNRSGTPSEAIEFDLHFGKSLNTPFALSQIIDSVYYVEPGSELTLGNIKDIKYMNGYLYILDMQNGVIDIIDKSGAAINKIDKRGRAKGEYISIQDFDINPINDDIHIYDANSKKMIVYSFNGAFIRSVKLDDIIRDFAVLDNGDYLFYTPDYAKGVNRGLWQADSLGGFKKQLVEIADDFLYGGIYPNYLSRIDDETIGLMGGEDHDYIYNITEDSVSIDYKLIFDIKIPKSLTQKNLINFDNYKGELYTKRDYFESERWIGLSVTDMKNNILFIYDKVDSIQYHITKESDLIEDIDIYGNFTFVSNNVVINALYPHVILGYPPLMEQFPQINEESNPVLVISILKK